MLKPLSPESSKELFYGRIPGSKEKWWRTKFLDVSEQIIKKCGGVPLAIVTTSSLLANKSENIKEWHAVRVSIGSGLENELDMYGMRQILLLSYYDLPSHLKTCLLYLSIFPEDYVIRKDRLIWRWVAEGFIQDQQAADLSFLEMGESYFNELVNRSLIQAAHEDVTGTPQACRVHDAVLDLILSLSMEESFITTVSGDGSLSLERSKQEVHRLSLHSYMTWPTMNMPKLRSLTIFKPASIFKSDDVEIGLTLMPSLSCSHLLRVLDLRDYELKDIASLGFLGSLSHLRYLGLSSSSCFEVDYRADWLPVEIGKLQFLQTLDISQTEIREVSSSIISGLRRLMCLRGGNGGGGFRWSATRLPNGLKDLTSLEVLESALVASERIAKELGYLTRLRVLEIRVGDVMHSNIGGGDNEENACTNALVESLGKLKKIESLCIINDFNTLCYDGSMEKPLVNLHTLRIDGAWAIPTWIEPSSLPGLTHLNIWVLQERKADIQVLGTLPYLRHLRLQAMEKPLERCVVGPHAFPCLVSCEIKIRGGLVPSIFPRGAMPKLEDFTFKIEREHLLGGGESTTVDDLALGHLRLLRSVTVMGLYIYEGDDEATKDKIMSAKEKLEYEAAVHPNHPLRLEITRWD
jgi:disease resistance protein RPM1